MRLFFAFAISLAFAACTNEPYYIRPCSYVVQFTDTMYYAGRIHIAGVLIGKSGDYKLMKIMEVGSIDSVEFYKKAFTDYCRWYFPKTGYCNQ